VGDGGGRCTSSTLEVKGRKPVLLPFFSTFFTIRHNNSLFQYYLFAETPPHSFSFYITLLIHIYTQNPHKVRTAKAERMSFGRFFFRFPNGEAGLDVYNRVSSFWATVSRDLLQLQAITDVTHLNILIVTHGLTLRLLLMRYFQLSVAEFESSYNSQNAKLVIMERKYSAETDKEYFQLQDEAKEALNLKGDISNNLPVYWRGDALDYRPYDREEDD
jgi:hypothetical protein